MGPSVLQLQGTEFNQPHRELGGGPRDRSRQEDGNYSGCFKQRGPIEKKGYERAGRAEGAQGDQEAAFDPGLGLYKPTLSAELLSCCCWVCAVTLERALRMPHFDAGATRADTARAQSYPGSCWSLHSRVLVLLPLMAPAVADKKPVPPPVF